ncbi:MAG TPA: hypothetical protein VI039_02215 [Solirubrobacterales bacterium]
MSLRIHSVLLLFAVAGLWAGAPSASATYVTAPEGVPFTETIEAEAEGSIALHSVVDVTCNKAAVEGPIQSHGAAVTAKGNLGSLAFSECGAAHVVVESAGSLEIHSTSGGNGTVTSSGAKISVTFTTIFGAIACEFATNNTDIGLLTASATSESKATLDVESVIPRTGGSLLCGNSAELTGSYAVAGPLGLTLDAAAPDVEGHFVTTDAANANVLGTEGATHVLEWTVDGVAGGIVCDESKWESVVNGGTADKLIFSPTFGKCHTTGSSENFAFKTAGCVFVFFVAKASEKETEQTMWLHCGIGRAEIQDPECTIKIPTHKGAEVTYTPITLNGKHALTVDFKVRIKMETEGKCGTAKPQGWLEGSLTLEAFDSKTEARTPLTAT